VRKMAPPGGHLAQRLQIRCLRSTAVAACPGRKQLA
jgi:hypothetical protein